MPITNILIIILLNISFISGQFYNGEQCFDSRTGNKGKCKFLKQCLRLEDDVKKQIKLQQCGFENAEALFCCPETEHPVLQLNLPGDISKKKCQEYSQHVYTTALNPTLLVGGKDVKVNQCFQPKNEEMLISEDFAKRKEFPHMTVIGYGETEYSDIEWLCGGSLISEKHVLTTAHCTTSKRGIPQKVRLGTVSLNKISDYSQELTIDKFVNHPEYERKTKNHDISIIFLKSNVEFSAFVRPACLISPNNTTKLIGTGFEKSGNDDEKENNELVKADMAVVSREVCSQFTSHYSKMPRNITNQMICAGHAQKHFFCQGNFGGVLQVLLEEPYCMHKIIGLRTHGEFCGKPYSFSIYARVDSYISWIESIVWP